MISSVSDHKNICLSQDTSGIKAPKALANTRRIVGSVITRVGIGLWKQIVILWSSNSYPSRSTDCTVQANNKNNKSNNNSGDDHDSDDEDSNDSDRASRI